MKTLESNHADLMSRCRAFISSAHHTPKNEQHIYPSITLSRQSGAGAFVIGQKLVEELNKLRKPEEPVWTLFDKNLVQQIIEDNHLPQSLEHFYSEEVKSHLENMVEEFLDLHPQAEQMFEQSCRTIIRLLRKGHVIIIGRGSNLIGRYFDTVTHVRLVAPHYFRVRHMVKTCGLSQEEAKAFISRADVGREKYLKRYFHRDIDDPLQYDLVLNTESVSFEEAVRVISDVALNRHLRPKQVSGANILQP